MNIKEFEYNLPKELIAQFPAACREQSRLLVIDRKHGRIRHALFKDIAEFLKNFDAIVLNDAKVRPVKLYGVLNGKETDVLLVQRIGRNEYLFKAKPYKKFKPGTRVSFGPDKLTALCKERDIANQSKKILQFQTNVDVESILENIGFMPLPPYIKRSPQAADNTQYQTVYARCPGAIASPTAGLHFTEGILGKLKEKGVKIIFVTLHVGLGTFEPVRSENIRRHKIHEENFALTKEAAREIEQTKAAGGRICAVGTTSCRVLESCAEHYGGNFKMNAQSANTDLFIYPPYNFKATDMLLTNFHLPRTTLLMLVCAFAGSRLCFKAYREAVKNKYRFYSYGDCMLII
ncbi:MAG: tRNA preQ1(34) S-adenosylmethionine ribosyltransferase-isomerase QueA [Candidatus Omnitrophica bacterium]|nr:tRNA preQ1(34) S-adenosylmethionine ribosyltransferase-isomerase QueA [Candidatus Omnitrophota bacterium]MBU1924453.1 tRNA preQ1(34) S-adenosylmethionine ribosyltransferase-isomerase QueA [Candidatus Omnitrophota bacterium]